jgi:ferric-dicitrate binding protein FerR (iron transport regulator)
LRYNAEVIRTSAVQPVKHGTKLEWNDRVRTDENGRVQLQLANSSTVSLGENSEIELIPATTERQELGLIYGRVHATLRNSSVRTQLAWAETVDSADFAIDASLPGRVRFICLAGRVIIRSQDGASRISCDAGEQVLVKRGDDLRTSHPIDDLQLSYWKNITDPDQAPEFQPFP